MDLNVNLAESACLKGSYSLLGALTLGSKIVSHSIHSLDVTGATSLEIDITQKLTELGVNQKITVIVSYRRPTTSTSQFTFRATIDGAILTTNLLVLSNLAAIPAEFTLNNFTPPATGAISICDVWVIAD